jgi:hypothetical protein
MPLCDCVVIAHAPHTGYADHALRVAPVTAVTYLFYPHLKPHTQMLDPSLSE